MPSPPDESVTDRLLAARTFTLHFRDDLCVQRLADMAMGKGFSARKARGGSTPFDQSAAGA